MGASGNVMGPKSMLPLSVRVEALQVAPDVFTKCPLSLMRAIGRIRWMIDLIRSVVMSPVYKEKGDQTDPSNNCFSAEYLAFADT